MDTSSKQRTVRWSMYILSILIWISGIAEFCVSLYLLYNHDVAWNLTRVDENIRNLYVSFYVLLGVGAFVALTAFTGYLGTSRKSLLLLVIYFICLVIASSANFASSILASVHRSEVHDFVGNSMNKTMSAHYGINLGYTNNFDSIQANLQCCGVNSYLDWLATYFGNKEFGSNSSEPIVAGRLPLTCCNPIGLLEYKGKCGTSFEDKPLTSYALYVNTEGCLDKLCEVLYSKYHTNIGLAVGNLILQLAGMIPTLLLIRAIRKE